MGKVAIMVDGGFYQKQAYYLFGKKDPKSRADELVQYCRRHLKENGYHDAPGKAYNDLYRIFYYDCKPSEKVIYHPLTQTNINLKSSPQYTWTNDFFKALVSKRKVALRLGELLESNAGYMLKSETLKKLCRGDIAISDLTQDDFYLDIKQKGVDMRIGLDIASLAQKRLVDRIVLIAGDSDFVPAAKHARREGIDFVLDPMWHTIKDSLNEHVDGLDSVVAKPPENIHDPLHINYVPRTP